MRKRRHNAGAELGPLFVSIFFGFAVNVLTAETSNWWGPLRPLTRYPWTWVPAAIVIWAGWVWWRGRRSSVTWRSGDNPYPGLAAYDAERAAVFFGREDEIAAVLARLDRDDRPVTPVVGPSGSGKSSLLRAGVIPRLGKLWQVIGPIRPDDALLQQPDPFDFRHRNGRTLMVIDQFEEVFTSTGEAHSIIASLENVLAGLPTLHIVVALRPEFLAAARELQPAWFMHPIAVGPLGTPHLREAIELPARAAGVGFEDGLVDAMVAEATVGDALPLLGMLLQRLYRESPGGLITHTRYEKAGRVGGAIAEQADEVYTVLGRADEVNRTLLRFVAEERGMVIRRRVARADVTPPERDIVEAFRAARLITDVDEGTALEFTHEAVFRQWRTLAELVEHNQERLRELTLLEHRASHWQSSRLIDELLRGQALDDAEQAVEGMLQSPRLVEFFSASRRAAANVEAERVDQIVSASHGLRGEDPALALSLVYTAIGDMTATHAANLTLWSLTVEPTRTHLVIGHSSTVTSMVWLRDGTLQTADDLGHIYRWNTQDEITDWHTVSTSPSSSNILLSQDGSRVLLSGTDVVEARQITTDSLLGRVPVGSTHYAPTWVGPDAFAVAEQYRTVTVYHIDGETSHPEHTFDVVSFGGLSASPDGLQLTAIASNEVMVRSRHDPDHSAISIPLPYDDDNTVLWSPDSSRFLTASRKPAANPRVTDGLSVTIYARDGSRVTAWAAHRNSSLTWSPDSRLIAVASSDEDTYWLEIRAAEDGRLMRRKSDLDASSGFSYFRCSRIAWSHDGDNIAICGAPYNVLRWNLPSDQVTSLPGGPLRSASWSPRADRAVSVQEDTVAIFSADHPPTSVCADAAAHAVQWSPGGAAIAIGGGGVVRVRHLSAGEESALFDVGHGAAGALRWSPDGSQIASGWAGGFLLGDEEAELALCDQRFMNIRMVQGLSGSAGGQFEWAPSGQLIAMTLGKEIALIENSTATIIRKWTSGNQPIRALAWSADGARLATASDEGTWIWDPADGSEVATCREHATLIAFSPDGRYLAGVNGSEFYLWDATTAATLAIPRISSASRTIDLRWTDDLVLTAADGTVMRWAVPPGDVTPTVTSGVRKLTTAERRRFRLPDVSDLT